MEDRLARKKYCKWHNSFSHTTNDCNYFHRQRQSSLNNGCLRLRDTHQIKLDADLFPVDMINFEEKRVLVSSKGKTVVVSDQLREHMMKPKNPEASIWKEKCIQLSDGEVCTTASGKHVQQTRGQQVEKVARARVW
jgi:hypothetical protein